MTLMKEWILFTADGYKVRDQWQHSGLAGLFSSPIRTNAKSRYVPVGASCARDLPLDF